MKKSKIMRLVTQSEEYGLPKPYIGHQILGYSLTYLIYTYIYIYIYIYMGAHRGFSFKHLIYGTIGISLL